VADKYNAAIPTIFSMTRTPLFRQRRNGARSANGYEIRFLFYKQKLVKTRAPAESAIQQAV
jgi:hypothetical protein